MVRRKICITTGTRAEYGLLRSLLKEISKNKKLELYLFVAGMHLSKKFGYTVQEINNDEVESIVKDAISLGYKHIDTAEVYRNEEGIGKAIKSLSISRLIL